MRLTKPRPDAAPRWAVLNVDGVSARGARTTDVIRNCHGCSWGQEDGAGGTEAAGRAAVRRHVARTGHDAGLSITRIYNYGPDR